MAAQHHRVLISVTGVLNRRSDDLGANTEISIAGMKRTPNTFVACVVRRSARIDADEVTDDDQATMGVGTNMTNRDVNLEGTPILNDPVFNRGTAFTKGERSKYHLEGLLPAAVDDLPTQLKRVLGHLSAKPTALEQYIYLQDLCDRNETLFYTTLAKHI